MVGGGLRRRLEMPCCGSRKVRLGMCPNAQWMHAIKPALPVEDREIDHLSKSPCVLLSSACSVWAA